jgi:hypothetical protein
VAGSLRRAARAAGTSTIRLRDRLTAEQDQRRTCACASSRRPAAKRWWAYVGVTLTTSMRPRSQYATLGGPGRGCSPTRTRPAPRLGRATAAFTLDNHTADIPELDQAAAVTISNLLMPGDDGPDEVPLPGVDDEAED